MQPLILASSSPRRADILRMVGIPYRVIPPSYNEQPPQPGEHAEDYVQRMAKGKARSVQERGEKGTIVSADTAILLGQDIIGKPTDKQDAFRMLRQLQGTKHSVWTGLSIIHTQSNHEEIHTVSTTVTFRTISDEEIMWYIAHEHVLDKAGAYAVQGKAARFIERIHGDFYAVVGLPIYLLSSLIVAETNGATQKNLNL